MKIFEMPSIKTLTFVSETIATDLPDTEGGAASGNTPDD